MPTASGAAFVGAFAMCHEIPLDDRLLAAEQTQNLDLHRVIYTIWATTALLIPALGFFIFADQGPRAHAYWRWFWTFSFLLFLLQK